MELKLSTLLLLWMGRIINSVLINGSLHPDEHQQSLETAYSDVFKRGEKTWEWDENHPIRSPIHPLLFGIFYYALRILHLDSSFAVSQAPKLLLQPLIAAICDYFILKFYQQICKNPRHIKYVLFVLYTIPMSVVFMCRTFSNQLEAVLNTVSLYYLMSAKQETGKQLKHDIIARVLMTITFLVRYSSAVPLPFLFLYRLLEDIYVVKTQLLCKDKDKKYNEIMSYHIKLNLAHLFGTLFVQFLVDVMYYQRVVFTFWNFFYFNIVSGQSAQFGQRELLYYLKYGLLRVSMLWVPFVLVGLKQYFSDLARAKKRRRNLEFVIYLLAHLITISLIPHKEDRFQLPIYPIIVMFAAYGFVFAIRRVLKYKGLIILAIVCSCMAANVFHNVLYSPATTMVMQDLRQRVEPVTNLMTITRCYSLPLYSQLHVRNVSVSQMDCLPIFISDVGKPSRVDPSQQIRSYLDTKETKSRDDLVILSEYYDFDEDIYQLLKGRGYKVVKRYPNYFWMSQKGLKNLFFSYEDLILLNNY